MATPTVNYSGISNTVMCARTMYSDVDGNAQRESDIKSRLTDLIPVVDVSADDATLSTENLERAQNNVLLVNRANVDTSIFVGADTQAIASSIVQRFNLTDNDERRVLRFQVLNGGTGLISFGNNDGSTSTYVKTILDSGSATGICTLFSSGVTGLNGTGAQRLVILSGTGVTGTTPTVTFQVFSNSM